MPFNPTNFRRINRSDLVPRNVRSDSKLVLILIKADGMAMTGTGAIDKDAIVRAYAPEDLLIMAWAGQWKTESYILDREDLDLIYRTTS